MFLSAATQDRLAHLTFLRTTLNCWRHSYSSLLHSVRPSVIRGFGVSAPQKVSDNGAPLHLSPLLLLSGDAQLFAIEGANQGGEGVGVGGGGGRGNCQP